MEEDDYEENFRKNMEYMALLNFEDGHQNGRGNAGNRGRGNAGNRGRGNAGNRGRGNAGNRGGGNAGNRGRGNAGNRGRGNPANRGRGNAANRGRGNAANRGRGNVRGRGNWNGGLNGGRMGRSFTESSIPNAVASNHALYDGTAMGDQNNDRPKGRKEPRKHILGYKRLESYLDMDGDNLVLELVKVKSSMEDLVQSTLKPDWVKLLIKLFAKATESTMRSNVIDIMSLLQGSRLMDSLIAEIQMLPLLAESTPMAVIEVFIDGILTVFHEFLQMFPRHHTQIPIDNLSIAMSRAGLQGIDANFRTRVEQLMTIRDDVLKDKIKRSKAPSKGKQIYPDGPPPEDFRTLPIVPSPEDVRPDTKPYLRPIKTNGEYLDTEEYLDIQFRLLKEDFVAPLREGIQEIVSGLQRGQRKHNLKIYDNVRVLYPVCTNGGIIHRISFDISQMKVVSWKHSRRLLFGSLVCLSKDTYETFLFATIAYRKPEDLAKGEIEIRFHGGLATAALIDPTDVFSMVESPSYYQAYCHVLEAMQNIDNDGLPFAKYIVEGYNTAEYPQYLGDFNKCVYNLSGCFTEKDVKCDLPLAKLSEYKGKVELNDSQKEAVRKALTNEFVVIQGPPGTGKTYVGLRIAHALLQNSQFWETENGTHMLIVCYTNHALDQFLEGLLKMGHTSLIRVGGRCESEALKKYSLKEIKFASFQSKKASRELQPILNAKRVARAERDVINERLKDSAGEIKRVNKTILDGKIYAGVTNILPPKLRIWFRDLQDICKRIQVSFMEVWLGVYPMPMEMLQEVQRESAILLRQPIRRATGDRRNLTGQIREQQLHEEEGIDIEGDAEAMLDRWVIDEDVYSHLDTTNEEDSGDDDQIEDTVLVDQNGFQLIAPSRSERKRRARQYLRRSNPMTKDEVNNVRDPFGLSIERRWDLYAYLIQETVEKAKDILITLGQKYEDCCKRLEEVNEMEDEIYLRQSKIIAMTTTGAARLQNSLQRIKPAIVIIEEAAEVLEAHVVTSLTMGTQHLVLIGDHKQLKPKPSVYQLAIHYNLELSLFERMLNNGMACYSLNTQHRMRPEIAHLLDDIYPDLRNHSSVENFPDILGVEKNLFFIDHSFPEDHNEELKSKCNQHEAEYIASLCWYLLLQGYEPQNITVLTMYTGQLLKLKALMPKAKFEGVRITAVDNFQGEENDIILLSLVRSNKEGKIGFTGIENRICVALSRAKHGLFVIGNITFLAGKSEYWARIMKRTEEGKHIGKSLKLICRNHPDSFIDAELARDFKQAPEGGCKMACGYRLKCGHACGRACHPVDQQHLKTTCRKSCSKETCKSGHRCPKMCHYGEKCGLCMVRVTKIIPTCNHEQEVACSVDPASFKCKFPIQRRLDCGHFITAACCKPDYMILCETEVLKALSCGHEQPVPCFKKDALDKISCLAKCQTLLECGHPCTGTCSACHQGRLHIKCTHDCNRPLACSHLCKEPCSKECPPCERNCINFCVHSRCPKKCGEICSPCMENCRWSCDHLKCTMLCHQMCDRLPCNEPCQKKLRNCGHDCIGLCREKCPKLCRICHKEEVEEIFFGNEDEEEARFIQLIDCPHIFEVDGLDQWMRQGEDTDGATSIELKVCPKCKTPIRKSWRYGNIIKRSMRDVNEVKKQVLDQRNTMSIQLKRQMNEILSEAAKLKYGLPETYAWSYVVTVISGIEAKYSALYEDEQQSSWETINENQVRFLEIILGLVKELLKGGNMSDSSMFDTEMFKTAMQELKMVYRVCTLNTITVQQMKDVDLELKRLALLFALLDTKYKCFKTKSSVSVGTLDRICIENAYSELKSGRRIEREELKKFEGLVDKVRKNSGAGAITKEEKQMVIKAMGLAAGHWYKCRNGHVYAIGECGGAMQESKCPECKESIGGMNHALTSGNAHASEFDGSRYAAWSDMANMNNFDLENLR